MTQHNTPDGLDVYEIYTDGIQKGNEDLVKQDAWIKTDVTPGTTPLPVYPNHSDLPEI